MKFIFISILLLLSCSSSAALKKSDLTDRTWTFEYLQSQTDSIHLTLIFLDNDSVKIKTSKSFGYGYNIYGEEISIPSETKYDYRIIDVLDDEKGLYLIKIGGSLFSIRMYHIISAHRQSIDGKSLFLSNIEDISLLIKNGYYNSYKKRNPR